MSRNAEGNQDRYKRQPWRMHCKLCDADEIVPRQRGRDPWESTLAAWFTHARAEHDMDHERAENEMWNGAMEWVRPPQPGSHSHLNHAEREVIVAWVIAAYVERRWSQQEIADCLSRSLIFVQRILRKSDVEMRPAGAGSMRPEVRKQVQRIRARAGARAVNAGMTACQRRERGKKGAAVMWAKKKRVDGSQLSLPMG